jgi:hypothetical protein
VTEALAASLLSLPIQPEVVGNAVEEIAAEVAAALIEPLAAVR